MIFAALGDYGYQVITEGEVETKPIKETPITTMIVSALKNNLLEDDKIMLSIP